MRRKKVRQAGVCCRTRRGRTYYYAEISGLGQVGLGCNEAAAKIRYDELKAEGRERRKLEDQLAQQPVAPQPATQQLAKPKLTVRAVLLAFLDWCNENCAPGTYRFYKQALVGDAKKSEFVSFDDYLFATNPELAADEITPAIVNGWITNTSEFNIERFELEPLLVRLGSKI